MDTRLTSGAEAGELSLRVSGRFGPHPGIEAAGPASAQDAHSVVRTRVALLGWDSTFADLPGDRRQLFGLLDAHLGGDDARFRVLPSEPGAVHRYLPALAAAVQDTITRLGIAEITGLTVDVPAAGPDPQSVPYLMGALGWFRAADPAAATTAVLTCDGATPEQWRNALDRLAQLRIAPFALASHRPDDDSRLTLPEWTVTAGMWVVAAVAAVVRAQGCADPLRLRIRPDGP